jgi:hypothetical protein
MKAMRSRGVKLALLILKGEIQRVKVVGVDEPKHKKSWARSRYYGIWKPMPKRRH